jgi:hypothetical protein
MNDEPLFASKTVKILFIEMVVGATTCSHIDKDLKTYNFLLIWNPDLQFLTG